MENVEVMNTGKWTPEQALTAAMKNGRWTNIVIVGEYKKEDGEMGVASVTANADTKTLLLLSEVLRARAISV
jgi:hypothetical protein